MKNQTVIVKVIYGENAAEYACDHGFGQAKRKITKGELEGAFETYEFDTEKDAATAIQILEDANGWEDNYWENTTKRQRA